MSTAFPTGIDAPTSPSAGNFTNSPSLSAAQTLQDTAIVALETKVGVTNSAVASSLDFKVASLQQSQSAVLTDTGGASNAYVLTPSPAITAYAAGQEFFFYPAHSNTNASTLNVSGLGTKAIQYNGNALISGEILTTTLVNAKYDGTAFQLLSPTPVTNGSVTTTFIDSASDDGSNVTGATGSWTDVTNLTATVTAAAGSNVRVDWSFPFDNQTASGTNLIRLVDTISAVTTTIFKYSVNPGSVGPRIIVSGGILVKNVAAGTHAYKMQMQPLAGSSVARAFYGQSTFSAEERKS